MPTFDDRIREQLAKPARPRAVEDVPPNFEEVVVEFAQGLEKACPFLEVVIDTAGRKYLLVAYPKHRRDKDFTVVRFRWTGAAFRIAMGEEDDFDDLCSPEELRGYLLRFLADCWFREVIAEYEGMLGADVSAYFENRPGDYVVGNVVLLNVSADDQKRIAEGAPGQQLTLRVKTSEDTSGYTKKYDASGLYRRLVSGGYSLKLIEHRPEGDEIVVVAARDADE